MVYHNFAWLQILAWLALSQLINSFSAYNLNKYYQSDFVRRQRFLAGKGAHQG